MHRTRLWSVLLLLVPARAEAQDIPPYVPANPLIESRSALYGQSYILPRPGWQVRFVSDYYNAVEVSQTAGANPRQSTFDAEVLQSDLWITHDLTPRVFVLANVPIRGAYSGFLDGFLIWYHHLTGLAVPARDELPRNRFQWEVGLPDTTVTRSNPGTFIGDLRAGIGMRLGRAEVIATATVPTASIAADGWTRHVVGTSLALVGDLVRTPRLVVDASASAGITPTAGRLAKYQRSVFAAGLASLRWRFAGQQAVFGGIWAQSSNWKKTGFDAVDDAEVVTDFGFLLHVGRRWPELQLGMTQDLVPKGPAMDVGFTVGLRW
jgi:hypothetical protein